eukprot:symbB.v1.2.039475.t1/scaffold6588.1/size16836/1
MKWVTWRTSAWQSSLDSLRQMPMSRFLPDVISYTSFSNALPAEMRDARVPLDVMNYNTAFTAEPPMPWPFLLCLLEEMQLQHVKADVINYNAVIRACHASSQWQLSLYFFSVEMPLLEMTPNVITYNAVLSLTDHIG